MKSERNGRAAEEGKVANNHQSAKKQQLAWRPARRRPPPLLLPPHARPTRPAFYGQCKNHYTSPLRVYVTTTTDTVSIARETVDLIGTIMHAYHAIDQCQTVQFN